MDAGRVDRDRSIDGRSRAEPLRQRLEAPGRQVVAEHKPAALTAAEPAPDESNSAGARRVERL
jgi:hypothetical protein